MTESKKILFVCIENAGRSQIAEAFFRRYASKNFQAISAGTCPNSKVNPIVVQVMKEVGIDIEGKRPKLLENETISDAFRTVNMGCMDKDACPALFVREVFDWNIPDPKGRTIEEVRKIRDEIEIKIKELLKNLKV